jgi:hypothetical protein
VLVSEKIMHLPKYCALQKNWTRVQNILRISRKLCASTRKRVRPQLIERVSSKFSASLKELCARPKNCAPDEKILFTSQEMRVTNNILHHPKQLPLTKQILRMSRNFNAPTRNCANFQTILCLSQGIVRVSRKLSSTLKKSAPEQKKIFCCSENFVCLL